MIDWVGRYKEFKELFLNCKFVMKVLIDFFWYVCIVRNDKWSIDLLFLVKFVYII